MNKTKGKLIKTTSNYFVLNDEFGNLILQNLSLKNCQAIERGYDLNELGMDYASTIYDGRTELTRFNGAKVDFIKGFQKALELMGDKKFSKSDVENNFKGLRDCIKDKDIAEFYIQLAVTMFSEIQQTEWEVEIITKPYTEVSEGFKLESKREPKLDKDGCLILKRI